MAFVDEVFGIICSFCTQYFYFDLDEGKEEVPAGSE